MTIKVLQPAAWPRPKGYANGMLAEGRQVYVAGQVGWDEQQRFAKGLGAQVRQTLKNIVAVLNEAGAGPEHLVRLTWYVTSRDEYYADLAEVRGGIVKDSGFYALTAGKINEVDAASPVAGEGTKHRLPASPHHRRR